MAKSFRLFVGNIPQGTSEEELRTEFVAYGVVESVEVKTKPNALSGAADIFGFVSLQTEDRIVSQCIKEFREQKYKGAFLNVSRAKESFLDRLKREREEAGAQKQNKNVTTSSVDPVKQPNDTKSSKATREELPTLPSLRQADESSSSESSDSESDKEEEVEEPSKKPTAPNHAPTSGPESNKKQEPELVKKWNQETYIEHGKLKIVSITGQVKEVIDRSKTHKNRSADGKQLSEKARIADEKRKQGLTKLSSAYEQQKLAIKNALSGEGIGSKRKIAFSDDEAEDSTHAGKRKLALFDGDGDGDEGDDGFEGNFRVRKQLSGPEGQKLYEMQTAYQGDNRFRLDDRFLDKYAVKKDDQAKSKKNKITEKERLKQLEILSNVTGKPIAGDKRNEQRNVPQMHRFDPSQRNEQHEHESSEDNRSKLSTIKQAERRENDFKVTDEKFYKVSDNLTGLLTRASGESNGGQDGGGFSLLSMFGKGSPAAAADDDVENNQRDQSTKHDRPKDSGARFKHESSESEEEPEENADRRVDEKTQDDEVAKNIAQRKAGYYSRQGIWKEKFFFLPNDSRFDDGRRFFGVFLSTQNVPKATDDGNAVANGDASRKDHTVDDLKKIYKKRRQREGKNMKMKSKLGFKVMNRRHVKK
ncbi:probable RNA-binding protein CG14230 [Anopheles darlingi]|uniref:probable RNA-binding protein CG14230 n=1 Tax=Anopheles darlingi TaxID=43151 RepID=UPI00210061BD|nr:probable RNA-binding protein CG14230 [Anopheles darlingi]XP_049536290.1 probable RNA-binding protein CG14230 [Anopheles darlingi]